MEPYKEQFPKGTVVRIAQQKVLEAFKRNWKYHHPLSDEQLEFAGQQGRVKVVEYYHGGDVLYCLENIPGTWHESCLVEISN